LRQEWLLVSKICTGIFFYYQQGERLRDFPHALGEILLKDNVFYYDAFYPSKPQSSFDLEPISFDTIQKVHSYEMIERIRATGDFQGALYSAAGTVAAAKRISTGELRNAFVFTGFGDHHAGSTFFGGGCYFNGAAIAVHELREKFEVNRFAIIDTDAHHGDGTWELFKEDPNVLYLCLCNGPFEEENGNVNIQVPSRILDNAYLTLAYEAFEKWVKAFDPEIIFWNWGYDGTRGDYGDLGLTPNIHGKLAYAIKQLAEKICRGQEIVVLCGGSRRDLARLIIPTIISILTD
jgi:acetoin utilization deacetylase AcuC-like enzyme